MAVISDADLPSFDLPELADNADSWGPNTLPDDIKDIPFAPFSKSDRLGKISDWTSNGNNNRRGNARFPQQYGFGSGQFQYKHEDDEASFSLVDNRPKPKQKFGRRPFQPRRFQPWNARNQQAQAQQGNRKGQQKQPKNKRWGYNRGKWRGYNNFNDPVDAKEPSVEVDPEWNLVSTIEFADLQKIYYIAPDAENLVDCGELECFAQSFDRLAPKNTLALQRFENRQHFTATTSDDPIIQRLAKEGSPNTVYATDTILGILMACAKSVNPWDILVRKSKGETFLDKRPNSKIDFLTVNENWNEVDSKLDKDSVNHPLQLSREATLINHNFSQQILSKDDGMKFGEQNPFLPALEKGNEPASVAYRYRKWNIDGGKAEDGETQMPDIKLVARCAINGYTRTSSGDKQLMTVRALNQFDSKLSGNVEWRQKLDQQSGAVLATEMKNNANKLSRWTAEALLAGTDEFRLGFVSRTHPKNSFAHEILMTKRFKPAAFAQSVSVKPNNLWATLRNLLQSIQSLEDGSYLLLKDPNKPEMHFFEVPPEQFAGETGEPVTEA